MSVDGTSRSDQPARSSIGTEISRTVRIGRARCLDPFDVPESGTAHVLVRLKRDGEVVAEGIAEWPLAPDVEWEIEVERSPFPLPRGSASTTRPNPTRWDALGQSGTEFLDRAVEPTASPVLGLRALRCRTLKVPKPRISMWSPRTRVLHGVEESFCHQPAVPLGDSRSDHIGGPA